MNVEPYDHLRAPDSDDAGATDSGDIPGGVYRVVGVREDGATLLRVADADGRRVVEGRVVQVPADDLAGFEPAENPDASPDVARRLSGMATGLVWSFKRLLPRSLR